MRHIVIIVLLSALMMSCGASDEGPSQPEEQAADREELSVTPVHPAFDISVTELSRAIADLPDDIRNNILVRSEYFLELVHRALTLPADYLLLVDKNHGLGPDYKPDDLVLLTSYNLTLNRNDLRLRQAIMPDVLAMTEAARIDGIELVFSSAYRSYDYQKAVFARHADQLGEEQAKRESAEPGKSQHQLGTTIDFGSITPAFGDTPAGTWLFDHAWKYGFSLSYPDGFEEKTGYMHEIWHYRYITRTGTALEHDFFNGIQHYLLTFWHENKDYFQEKLIR